jgi:hypothetical protein
MFQTTLSVLAVKSIVAVLGVFILFQSNCSSGSINQNQTQNVANSNITPTTPKNNETYAPNFPSGNGFFILYYGDGKTKEELEKHFRKIRETKPNFVIVGHFDEKTGGALDVKEAAQVICFLHGESAENCVKTPNNTENKTGIRTIYYVSNTCGSDTLACSETDRKNRANAPKDYVKAQVKGAMDLGYDGIFFDVTNRHTEDAENIRYKEFADYVQTFGKKTVIVNPGVSDENVCRMFQYADIVSVENYWNVKVHCAEMNIKPWRWLAIQGDPSNEKGEYAQPPKNDEGLEAIRRLNDFRKNGGFWYFTTGWNGDKPVHWRLPEFLESFANEARKLNPTEK